VPETPLTIGRLSARVSWDAVDEGFPIAYEVLEKGVPVLSSDGEQIGTVHHVVAAPEKDIFHGLVVSTPKHGRRFIEAADVESLHEHGVDLRIDSAAAQSAPEPGGGAPVYDEDPATINKWSHWAHRLSGRSDWHLKR
jgi:sporulation protein YlmC with PRC-barrel domain